MISIVAASKQGKFTTLRAIQGARSPWDSYDLSDQPIEVVLEVEQTSSERRSIDVIDRQA
jgi:hypothetical protein